VTHDSAALKERIERRLAGLPELEGRVCVLDFTCFGRCDEGPNMLVHALAPGDDPWDPPDLDGLGGERGFYTGMDSTAVDRLVDEHLGADRPLDGRAEPYR
jgi:(2Fe-2S) ferredoxin